MDELILRAEPRDVVGKKVKRLRRAGQIPGVVYGPVISETVQVSVPERELRAFYHQAGHSTLFTLDWGDGQQAVFIREVQVDPVRHNPVHVDFFAPNLLKDLNATVPVAFHNASDDAEGMLMVLRNEVEVRGLPANIPHQVDADLRDLMAVGDAFHAGELVLPVDIIMVTDPQEVLAHVMPETLPEVEEVEEAEEAEEAAEAAEGAEAEAGDEAATAEATDEGKGESSDES